MLYGTYLALTAFTHAMHVRLRAADLVAAAWVDVSGTGVAQCGRVAVRACRARLGVDCPVPCLRAEQVRAHHTPLICAAVTHR